MEVMFRPLARIEVKDLYRETTSLFASTARRSQYLGILTVARLYRSLIRNLSAGGSKTSIAPMTSAGSAQIDMP